MPIFGKTETVLDRVPRCILGQLVRDYLRLLSQAQFSLSSAEIREGLLSKPSGRWCLLHAETIVASRAGVEHMLPFYLAEMMVSIGWVVKVGNTGSVRILPAGRKALRDILAGLDDFKTDLSLIEDPISASDGTDGEDLGS